MLHVIIQIHIVFPTQGYGSDIFLTDVSALGKSSTATKPYIAVQRLCCGDFIKITGLTVWCKVGAFPVLVFRLNCQRTWLAAAVWSGLPTRRPKSCAGLNTFRLKGLIETEWEKLHFCRSAGFRRKRSHRPFSASVIIRSYSTIYILCAHCLLLPALPCDLRPMA